MKPSRDDLDIAEWFKDHQATVAHGTLGNTPISRILWRKPGTWQYHVDYLIYGGVLFVCGDLDEATYEWPQAVDLPFLAGCGLDYFGSKCRASSSEPRGKTWSSERVQMWVEQKLAEWAAENPIVDADDNETPRAPLTFKQCVDLMDAEDCVDLDEAITHPHAWGNFLAEGTGLLVSDVKDTESGEYPRITFEDCGYFDVGYTWDMCTRAHLIGLTMAHAQLQARAAADLKEKDLDA